MLTEIKVRIRNVYGNDVVYPACERSQIFADIAGSKTLTVHTLKKIRKLGITFQLETETANKIFETLLSKA